MPRLSILFRATALVCIVAACDSGSITGPLSQPDARPIVFLRLENGWSLYTVSPRGGASTRLNLPQTGTLFPALSPDGSRLAFVVEGSSPGGVYVGAADGSGARLVHPAWTDRITWSPDATRLAIAVNGEIIVVPLDGGTPQTITSAVDVYAGYPSWSSRGRIAFDTRGVFSFTGDLYTIAPDGSDLRLIVHEEGNPARDPAWSPDGSRLAFAMGHYGASSIYTVDANGNDRRRVTPEPEWGFGSTDLAPAWAPSGGWIAFSHEHTRCAGAECEGRYDVMVVRSDGRGVRNLTADAAWGGVRPSW